MTKEEFNTWEAETRSSKTKWVRDEIRWHNQQEIHVYKGGESGIYITIEKDGTASTGTYQDAIPHIGEALFQEKYRKKFANQDEAFARIMERLGVTFLINITTGFP